MFNPDPVITPRELLLASFRVALQAANPGVLVPGFLPVPPRGRTWVMGAGKAAASMARALEENWPAASPLSGSVITPYRHGLACRRIEVTEAGHPLPDGRGATAAKSMLEEAHALTADDLLLLLLSGGGSSLLALPAEGISLEDLRAVTQGLLASGARIQEINTVRKHLTLFSGGQVAALSKAPVVSLIISDVVGNDPTHIASGPSAPDPTTYADALDILKRYGMTPPDSVNAHLQQGARGEIADTPKPGDTLFDRVDNRIIGSAQRALVAAEMFLRQAGITVINLGEIEGEASEVAKLHATRMCQLAQHQPRPFALLSGGETTVKVSNASGRGGRNSQYLLALGIELRDLDGVWALACDTDGIDGTEDNAGAVWTADTYARAIQRGLNPEAMLCQNNAYDFFQALDALVTTGPTRTNVNDFRLVVLT